MEGGDTGAQTSKEAVRKWECLLRYVYTRHDTKK